MAFLIYNAEKISPQLKVFTSPRGIKLAGNQSGLIYKACKPLLSEGDIGWLLSSSDLLEAGGYNSRNFALFSDVTPNRKGEANVLKIISIAGYTYERWTPLMLRLETTLQGDVTPGEEEAAKQAIVDDGSADTVVTFLYLNGGYRGGTWNPGMVGYVNGPLLWADALTHFRTCMP